MWDTNNLASDENGWNLISFTCGRDSNWVYYRKMRKQNGRERRK